MHVSWMRRRTKVHGREMQQLYFRAGLISIEGIQRNIINAHHHTSRIRSATPADRLTLYFDLIACEIHFLCFFFVYFYLFCLFSFFCKLGMSIIKRNAMPQASQAASSSYTVIVNDQRTESKKEIV